MTMPKYPVGSSFHTSLSISLMDPIIAEKLASLQKQIDQKIPIKSDYSVLRIDQYRWAVETGLEVEVNRLSARFPIANAVTPDCEKVEIRFTRYSQPFLQQARSYGDQAVSSPYFH